MTSPSWSCPGLPRRSHGSGDNPVPMAGDKVFVAAEGSPLAQGRIRSISSTGIEHDIPIDSLRQGGALVNDKGEVLGMTSSRVQPWRRRHRPDLHRHPHPQRLRAGALVQHQQPRGTVADPEHNHAIGATGPRGGRGVGPYGGRLHRRRRRRRCRDLRQRHVRQPRDGEARVRRGHQRGLRVEGDGRADEEDLIGGFRDRGQLHRRPAGSGADVAGERRGLREVGRPACPSWPRP